jgi:hypothetical protein
MVGNIGEVGDREAVVSALMRLKDAWLEERYSDLLPLVHEQAVVVTSGFSGRVVGREAAVAGFVEFGQTTKVHSLEMGDVQADVVGDTAVGSFAFVMVYERERRRFLARGRDMWVFARHDGTWLAVWRTMVGLEESPLGASE